MSENELTPLERALRTLTPSAAPFNRDVVMFQAGRTSASRSRLWPLMTAASSLIALGLGFVLAPRPAPQMVVQQPVVPGVKAPAPPIESPAPPTPSTVTTAPLWEPPPTRYDQVRDNVINLGLDGLPTAPRQRHESTRADLLLQLN
jgi:hypothetical protein